MAFLLYICYTFCSFPTVLGYSILCVFSLFEIYILNKYIRIPDLPMEEINKLDCEVLEIKKQAPNGS